MSTILLARRATATAVVAVLFWIGAAVAVAVTHQRLDAASPGGCVAVSALIIIATAYVYMRFAVREAPIDQALFVGMTWALLSIIAEMVGLTRSAHPWYPLFGPPAHAIFRDVLLLAWIAAPALFARRRS